MGEEKYLDPGPHIMNRGVQMKKIKVFFINIVLLTATSLLLHTINITFRVYLSNKLGPSGIGLYQLIMSVFMLAITFSISGIKLATTRLVAEELGIGNHYGAKKAMHRCLAYSILFGVASAMVLYTSADYIGIHWLNEEKTILSLHLLAFSLPFIAMSSVLSGYFIAVRRIFKSATVQILEQLVSIGFTVALLTAMLPKGIEYACAAIVIGTALSELASFLLLFFLYLHDSRRYRSDGKTSRHLTGRMLKISLPIAFSTYIRSGLSTIEHLLIPSGLRKSGASSDSALITYGTIHGMVMPILMFPSAFLTALADLLVPELAESNILEKNVRIHYIIGRVFHLTLLFSIGVMGALFCYSQQLGMAIYQSREAAYYLRLLAPLVPIMYLDTTVDAVLKGLGYQINSMRINILDSLISVILVYFLLPAYAINGYLITIYATETINFVLSFCKLVSVTKFRPNIFSCILKPVFCILSAVGCSNAFWYALGVSFSSPAFSAVAHISLAAVVYFLLLYLLSCITRDDLHWFRSIFQ